MNMMTSFSAEQVLYIQSQKKNHSHGFTSLFQSFLILFHLVINLFTYILGVVTIFIGKNGMN